MPALYSLSMKPSSAPIACVPLERAAEALRAHGITPTSQRIAIAARLLAAHMHCSAEAVYEMVRDEGVSRATVYNTLRLLAERGLLREVIVDPSRVFYDSNVRPHHHLYDVETGRLVDVDAERIRVETASDLAPEAEILGVEVVIRVRGLGA